MTRTAALFLRQFVRSPRTVGAVLPSSAALARAMLAPIDFASARTIVEFGPGTGAFTRAIAAAADAGLPVSRHRTEPGIRSRAGGGFPAAHLRPRQRCRSDADPRGAAGSRRSMRSCVGCPGPRCRSRCSRAVFAAIDRALVPGGVFVTFGYLQSLVLPGAWALRRRLRRSFAEVGHSPVVWANVPPAFAYICRK